MIEPRISLFAEHEREDRRSKIGDPLVGLTKHVDFEALAASIDAAAPRPSRAKGGRPPYLTLLMVKILVLQQLYNLADDALEYHSSTAAVSCNLWTSPKAAAFPMPRPSGCFVTAWPRPGRVVSYSNKFNNSYTSMAIWLAAVKSLMPHWSRHLSSAISARKPTPSKKAPCRWRGSRTSAQKDVDARWTKKHGRSYFGYKLHASVDKRYKLLRKIEVTHAAVANTTVFESLLDRTKTSRAVFADRGYPTNEREATLRQAGWRVNIQLYSAVLQRFRSMRQNGYGFTITNVRTKQLVAYHRNTKKF